MDANKKVVTEYCRTCLSTDNLVNIFHGNKTDATRAENLHIVTGLLIQKNDGLSEKVCKQCMKIINSTLKFRLNCKEVEKALLAKSSKVYIHFSSDSVIKTEINSNKESLDKKPDCNDVKVKGRKVVDRYDKFFDMRGYRDSRQNEPRQKRPLTVICDECGKLFFNKHQMLEHKRAKHGLERIHNCPHCSYQGISKQALVVHMRRHTGERPYACDHCGASFISKPTLIQHIVMHSSPGENTFQCSLCSKVVKSRMRLNMHMYDKHYRKKYKYICPACRNMFMSPGYVREHLVKAHGVARADQPRIIQRCLRDSIPEELPQNPSTEEVSSAQAPWPSMQI